MPKHAQKTLPAAKKRNRQIATATADASHDGSSEMNDDDDATGNATEDVVPSIERDSDSDESESSESDIPPVVKKDTPTKTSQAKDKATTAKKTTAKTFTVASKKTTKKPTKKGTTNANRAWGVRDILGVREAHDWTAKAPSYQVLVQWKDFEEDEPTWYNLRTLSNDRLVLELLLAKILEKEAGAAVPGVTIRPRQPEDEEEGTGEAV